jgi:hypothetical protein
MKLIEDLEKMEATAMTNERARRAQTHKLTTREWKALEEYKQIRTSVIRPPMEKTRDFLLSKGHGARIDESDDLIGLTFCFEDFPSHEIERSVKKTSMVFTHSITRRSLSVQITAAVMDGKFTQVGRVISMTECTRDLVETFIKAAARAILR